MSVGIVEVALLVVVTLATAIIVRATKVRWLVVVPAYYLVAVLVSPPDAISGLLIAIPNIALFALAFRHFAKGAGQAPV
jgi:Sec-independent protein secretion pathway component TatC